MSKFLFMHDDVLSPDSHGAATIQLISTSWAGYLQQVCARLKTAGLRHKNDGVYALVIRLRLSRPSTY